MAVPLIRSPESAQRVVQVRQVDGKHRQSLIGAQVFMLKFGITIIALFGTLHGGTAILMAQGSFVEDNAVLQVIEERKVPSLISGVIQKSHVVEGALLKKQETLMEIDDAMASLDLEKIEKERELTIKEASTTVELDYARKSIEVSRADLGRALESNRSQPGAIAQTEIDQLTMVVERAIAEKRKTEFQIELKKMQIKVRDIAVSIGKKTIQDHRINSPITGMVVEVLKKEGEWVEASETVAKVVRLDKLRTEVKMPAAIALDNLVGRKAFFTPKLKSLKSKTYEAKVIFVNPAANPVNASVRVWIEIDNRDLDLIPGLTGKLTVQPKPAADELDTSASSEPIAGR